jgi:putative protease
VSVNTEEQLLACEQFEAAQILFLSYDLLCQLMIKQGKATLCDRLHKIYAKGMGLYLLLPRVMRHQTFLACERLWQEFGQEAFDGIVTNSLEGFALLKNTDKKIIADAGLYSFNNEACRFLEEHGIDAFTVPYECSYHEIKEIHTEKPGLLTIYGYLPLMESAGCVAKTMSHCDKRSSLYKLTDRYQKQFFVKTHCNRCENTIYNSVPFNLMGEWEKLEKLSVSYRIDFTIESAEEVRNVLKLYLNCRHNTKKQMTGSMGSVQKNATFERAEGNYTKGYFKRGVE